MGMDTASPIRTSSIEPCAAPPTASTLSTPITASATMIVCTAPRTDVAGAISWLPALSCVSFQPM